MGEIWIFSGAAQREKRAISFYAFYNSIVSAGYCDGYSWFATKNKRSAVSRTVDASVMGSNEFFDSPHESFTFFLGFIMMTPQLFINYKMKSVAHLPWRMMTYKALNTFIDDLFAFVIKMPTLYRIGCFRDGKSALPNIMGYHSVRSNSLIIQCVPVCLT